MRIREAYNSFVPEYSVSVSVAHSAPEPEVMSEHLVGPTGLFY